MTDKPPMPRLSPEQVERVNTAFRRMTETVAEAFSTFARAFNDLHSTAPHLRPGGTMPERSVRDDEQIVQISPGTEPPEVVAAFGAEVARQANGARLGRAR